MLNQIKIILLIIILNISINVFGQSNNIYEIRTEAIVEFDLRSPGSGWAIPNFILINGFPVFQYSLENQSVRRFNYNNDIGIISGISENELIIGRVEENSEQDFVLYLYDPSKDSYNRLNGLLVNKNIDEKIDRIFHYKDNQYIVSYAVYHRGPVYYNTYLINSETGDSTLLINFGKTYDLSKDKLNLLVMDYTKNIIGVYNIENKKYMEQMTYKSDSGYEYNCFFKTNNLILFKFPGIGEEYGSAKIYDLTFNEIAEYHYYPPETMEKPVNMYTRINNSEYAYLPNDITKNRVLIKTFGETEALDELGLLFHPTTAVLNDDRVRMREWPLLDAKHLAFLEKGEEVEVLDRSGIKIQIGDMNDYWYKIKRADGTEGWSYGYFLDLAEEE